MFRKTVFGASAAALLLATAGSAFAADLPYVAPYQAEAAAPAGYYDWTGFYVGAQAGYTWADPSVGPNVDGFLGGVHAGYNHQMNNWVLGVEGDIEYSAADGSSVSPAGDRFKSELEWMGSVRARVGYAMDRTLVYATGGVAFGKVDAASTVGAVTATDSNTHVGWTAGAGLEYAVTQNITTRAEYRYTDLGDKTYDFGAAGGAGKIGVDSHAVRVGASYKF